MTKSKIAFQIGCIFLISMIATTGFAEERDVDQKIHVVTDSPWDSLEILKLMISLLTPAAMIYIGLWMDRRIKELEHRQWTNQKVIEKRMEVFEKITPMLNDMMCYFARIGGWKEASPVEIIGMKRGLDKTAYIYAPLFPGEFLNLYNNYMETCFATFRGAGKDAQLRTEREHYADTFDGEWKPEWDDCFTGSEEASTTEEVSTAYREFLGYIAHELGVGLERPKFDDKGKIQKTVPSKAKTFAEEAAE